MMDAWKIKAWYLLEEYQCACTYLFTYFHSIVNREIVMYTENTYNKYMTNVCFKSVFAGICKYDLHSISLVRILAPLSLEVVDDLDDLRAYGFSILHGNPSKHIFHSVKVNRAIFLLWLQFQIYSVHTQKCICISYSFTEFYNNKNEKRKHTGKYPSNYKRMDWVWIT